MRRLGAIILLAVAAIAVGRLAEWLSVGMIVAVLGSLLLLATVASVGASVFAPMRTRDRLKTFVAAPFAGVIAAIIATMGYSMTGLGDVPPGYDTWILPVVATTFGLGIFLGIVMRVKGIKSPAVAATEVSAMKRCPDCAEQIQATAIVCRFCGHRFAP